MAELFRTWTDAQYERALDSWRFALSGATEPLEPKFTSLFGAVFFASPSDAIWLLDPIAGSLQRRWPDRDALDAELDTERGQDEVLLAVFVQAAERAGVLPGDNQILDFAVPPVFGGSFDVDNLRCGDFVVTLNIAGQLHDQLRDKPPGWRPSRYVVERESERKPRRLFGRRKG